MIKNITTLLLLTLLAGLVSCKSNEISAANAIPAEYIIAYQKPVTEQQLKVLFKSLSPFTVLSTSPKASLIKFSQDPGIQNLEKLVKGTNLIDAVQPNYQYQKTQ